jgi:hypothetical protein
MKKIALLLILALFSINIYAQDEENQKSASDYLPTAGNFGVGVDATPFLNYIGNAFNGTQNNSLNFGSTHLFFKYFLSDNSSIRLKLDLYNSTTFNKNYSRDDAAFLVDPLTKAQVEDLYTSYSKNNFFSLGYQMYVGENRLRGFFGADLGYGFNSSKVLYQYGNTMNGDNPAPTTNLGLGQFNPTERNLLYRSGTTHTIGFGVFTGAEYYIMPKFSIGLEVGISFRMSSTTQGYRQYETMLNNTRLEMDEALYPNQKGFNLSDQTPYSYGNLFLMFHF